MKEPGRRKKFDERMIATFAKGTFRRVKQVLRPEEDRTDFVRAAVANEIQRREESQ